MSLGHGSSIVKDNLLFYYDIANTQKSWKGKPTTNLVASPYSLLTGFAKAAGVTVTDNVARNIDGTQNVGLITGTGWLAYVGATTTNGQQYTTSWIIKKDIASVTVFFGWGGSHQGNLTNFTFDLLTGAITGVTQAAGEIYGVRSIGDFWVVYYSSTLSAGNAYYPQITIGTGVNVYFGGIQIETGNVASPLVTGTRSNTQALLDLTGRNTITATNLTYASNNTFSFDGVDDYLDCGSAIQLTNDFTLEVWHKNINTGYLIDQGNIGSDPSGCLEYLNRGLTLSFNNIEAVTATGTFQDTTTWNSVACTFSSGTVNFYINGTYDSTKTTTTRAFIPSGILKIGRRALATSLILSGEVSNVKIYGRVLSAAEIRQNFEALRGRYEI